MISVIIRTYKKRSLHLITAVKSVLAQKYQNFELIIVEDGGNSYASLVSSFGDSRIRYYGLPKVGRCVTGNFGLSVAVGNYLCLLDDDDYFLPNHLSLLSMELKRNPDCLAAYGGAYVIRSNMIYSEDGELMRVESSKKTSKFYNEYSLLGLLTVNLFPIQAVVFDRRLYEMYGGLSPEMENLEDWDMWVRYSQTTNFKGIKECTSAFRIPKKQKESEDRSAKIVKFYQKAFERFRMYNRDSLSFYDLHCELKNFQEPHLAV